MIKSVTTKNIGANPTTAKMAACACEGTIETRVHSIFSNGRTALLECENGCVMYALEFERMVIRATITNANAESITAKRIAYVCMVGAK